MFRPNRIGSHPVIDLDAGDFLYDPSAANYTTSEGTAITFFPQTDSATVPTDVGTVNWNTTQADQAYINADLASWSFGKFISGVALNERPMMISYNASMYVRTNAGDGIKMELGVAIGRAKSSTVTVDKTAQTNELDTYYLLKQTSGILNNFGLDIHASGTLINSVFAGGAAGLFGSNPICLFLYIKSRAAASTVDSMSGSLSVYRYAADIDTFDPNR